MRDLLVALVSDNFHVMALPLVAMNAVPDEVTILAIISPQRDLSQAEVSAIDAFVQRGIPAIVSGFGLPQDAFHAPDESFALSSFELGLRSARALYEDLAGLR